MNEKLNRTLPAQLGLSTEAVNQYVQQLSSCKVHSYMISCNEDVIAEGAFAPHRISDEHTIYSLTKTIQSLAVGLAIDQYNLQLDDLVLKFFPEYESCCANSVIKGCTIRNLLTMNCGLPCEHSDHDFYESDDWIEEFFTTTPLYVPGTYFEYDNRCAFMISAIIQKISGQSVAHLLQEKVFTPMDISDVYWECDRNGVSQGGWGIRTGLESITKLGILFLNKGKWKNQQLINADWIQQCLTVQAATDHLSDDSKIFGYSYQLWKAAPEGVWCGRGAFGQLSIICQNQGIVISTFAGSQNYNDLLKATWTFLTQIDHNYKDQIAEHEWIASDNPFGLKKVSIAFGKTDLLTLQTETKKIDLKIGHESWEYNTLPMRSFKIMETIVYGYVACQGHWDQQDYILKLSYLNTPFTDQVRLSPQNGEILVSYQCYPMLRIRGAEYHFKLKQLV